MLLTMVQPPSVSSSSRPSLHRAFSFLSQYSDESSTLLLHRTWSTQMNSAQMHQRTQWMTHTHTFWVTHPLSSASLCFPFRRMGSIDLSLGHLFQFKCPQLGIRNLSAKQTVIVSSLRRYFNETLGWNVNSRSWLFIMFFPLIIWCVVTAGQAVLITS